MKQKEKIIKIKYKDKKWEVTTHKDGSISIFFNCRCGHESDIAFDSNGEYLGSGQTV